MTNYEKFKTAEERAIAFDVYCRKICTNESGYCNHAACAFAWLGKEAEEEHPLPCIYCGNDMMTFHDEYGHGLICATTQCGATTPRFDNPDRAVCEYNKIARAVMEAEKKEEK